MQILKNILNLTERSVEMLLYSSL